MNRRVGVSGFGKELLFMGKVNADVPDQLFKYALKRLLNPPCDNSFM
jgi:hypothetical protein